MLADVAQIIETIKPTKRPFHAVPIQDNGEPLMPLEPMKLFAFQTPHVYREAGAPYEGKSPYSLRKSVAERLAIAHSKLQELKPGWRIKVFDAYRPVEVQSYMVAHSFAELAKEAGLNPTNLTPAQRDEILNKVYRIWSPPNRDPATPPPHSTGAAIDITLVDNQGHEVDMGSAIDFNGDVSNPDYFKDKPEAAAKRAHTNRDLLFTIMKSADFTRHPAEWWHFSYGDQLWVWLKRQEGEDIQEAMYGRVE
jgi:D-alanyl-D-alanine dipeptidase